MAARLGLWIACFGIVSLLSTPAQAALLHRWLLDDSPSDIGDTLVDSAGNRDMTVQGGFFGADVTGTTGYDGVANSAVQFHNYNSSRKSYADFRYSTDPNDPDDPFTIVEPANPNGGIMGHLGDWTVEYWLRMDQTANKHQPWSEDIYNLAGTSSGGPVLGAQFQAGTGDLWFLIIMAGDHDDPNILPGAGDAMAQPPGGEGFETGKWYYIAQVFEPAVIARDEDGNPIWEEAVDENGDPYTAVGYPATTIENGAEHLYIWDGTTLVSDSTTRDTIMRYGFHDGWVIDNFRLAGNYVEGALELSSMDDFSIFDQAFDPNSYLFRELGIPEPASLAILGLGSFFMIRRRSRGSDRRGQTTSD